MSGTLYLVPATLGDLKAGQDLPLLDASLPPAVRERIAALTAYAVEDAKTARAFLKACGTSLPLQGIEMFEIGHTPEPAQLKLVLDKLATGVDVGVLSEAGCPGIADPGSQLARMAHAAGVRVAPLVGPSSILLALMASGLEGQRFAFHGYLPVKSPAREEMIRELETRSRRQRETQIVIETPYRNGALQQALLASLKPDTWLTVAVDLTLASEAVRTRRVSQWRQAAPKEMAPDKHPAVFLILAA
ncbi:MAG TPA: SAM-dependent methyltransferase [Burkholderiales bacterium]